MISTTKRAGPIVGVIAGACTHTKPTSKPLNAGCPRALAGTSSPSSAASHENYWQRKTAEWNVSGSGSKGPHNPCLSWRSDLRIQPECALLDSQLDPLSANIYMGGKGPKGERCTRSRC